MSGDQINLDEIEDRARALVYALGRDHLGAVCSFSITVAMQDVPALVARVRVLEAENKRMADTLADTGPPVE